MPTAVHELLPRLRDPEFTRVLIVTLPEATPVHEAAKLQEDLVRAHIRPFAWVINQSLSPLAVHDPVLVARRRHEGQYIAEVIEGLAARTAHHPLADRSPRGGRATASRTPWRTKHAKGPKILIQISKA